MIVYPESLNNPPNRNASTKTTIRLLLIPVRVQNGYKLTNLVPDIEGFDLIQVEGLSEALSDLIRQSIDVVLLDAAWGLDALSQIMETAPSVPVLILSDSTDETIAIEAVRCGAQDYLIKDDLDGQTLWRSVQTALARQQRNRSFQETERYLRSLLRSSPDTIYSLDLSTRQASFLNRDEFCGYSREELEAPDSILHAVHPDDLPDVKLFWQGLLQSQESDLRTVEYRLQRKDGVWEWVLTRGGVSAFNRDGTPHSLLVTLSIITDRKQAQKDLEASEQHFRSLFNQSNDAVFLIDLEGRHFVTNQKAADMLGYSLDEVTRLSFRDVVVEAQQAQSIKVLDALKSGQKIPVYERIFRRKNGTEFPVEVNVELVQDAAGNPLYLQSIVRDITGRKQTEDTLRKLSSAVEQSANSIIITDADGHIEYVNPKVIQTTGYTVEEIIGQNPRLFKSGHTPPEEYKRMWETITAGDEWEGEFHNKRKNGELFWESASISPIRDELGTIIHYLAIKEDITERKQAQDALRASEERLRAVVSGTPIILFTLDTEGCFTLIQGQGLKILGLEQDALVGQSAFEDYSPFIPDIHEPFRQALAGEEVSSTQDLGGVVFDVRYSPLKNKDDETVGVIGVASDITKQHRSQENLAASEARFRSLTESTLAGVYVIQDAQFVYVNPALARMTGYTREEIVGKLGPLDVFHPDDRALTADQVSTRTERGTPAAYYNLRLVHKNGSIIPCEVMSTRADFQGRPAFIGTLLDTTERRKAEEARLESQQLQIALEKEQELNALKNRFISMASHEYRTPLATIHMASETLHNYWSRMDEEQRERRFVTILDQVGRMKSLIDGVLMIGRLESDRVEFSPTALDLNEFCQTIVDELRDIYGETHNLAYSHVGDCPNVQADEKLMRQVITNLLTNAVKYSPDGGTVRINLSCNDREAALSVADEGIGIPEADQVRLYETFHRAANVGRISGTGLGLAITKQAIELHEGTIDFESKVDVGTTFTVHLPL